MHPNIVPYTSFSVLDELYTCNCVVQYNLWKHSLPMYISMYTSDLGYVDLLCIHPATTDVGDSSIRTRRLVSCPSDRMVGSFVIKDSGIRRNASHSYVHFVDNVGNASASQTCLVAVFIDVVVDTVIDLIKAGTILVV